MVRNDFDTTMAYPIGCVPSGENAATLTRQAGLQRWGHTASIRGKESRTSCGCQPPIQMTWMLQWLTPLEVRHQGNKQPLSQAGLGASVVEILLQWLHAFGARTSCGRKGFRCVGQGNTVATVARTRVVAKLLQLLLVLAAVSWLTPSDVRHPIQPEWQPPSPATLLHCCKHA